MPTLPKSSNKETIAQLSSLMLSAIAALILSIVSATLAEFEQPAAYSGRSGQRFRKHPDTKPEVSGHFADLIDYKIIAAFRQCQQSRHGDGSPV